MSKWFEDLPEQCPDADAKSPNGETYYRLVDNETICCDDFCSHRKKWPHKVFKTSECVARAVSVFTNPSGCERLLLLSLHSTKKIALVQLTSNAGLIKQQGRDPCHYSWWRSSAFDPVANSALMNTTNSHA